jgi:hypothetical protein
MKAKKAGMIVAKALESSTGTNTIMAFVNVGYHDPDPILTSTGQINVDYTDTKNEIESANYYLKDSLYNLVDRIGQFKELASAKIKAGLITTTNLISKNIVSETSVSKQLKTDLISPLSENRTITITGNASISGTLTTNKLVIANEVKQSQNATDSSLVLQVNGDASISGTLYANKIISPEGSLGDLMTEKIASLREEIRRVISDSTIGAGSSRPDTELLAESQTWSSDPVETLRATSLPSTDIQLSANLIINSQLTVQGNTQLGKVFVADNFIETTDTALYIQPSAIGSVHILGDTLVIADTGSVVINGSLDLNGTLLAQTASISSSLFGQLISAIDASVSGTLTANNLVSNKITIATESATIIADAGFSELATSSAELNSNATAGVATLPAGKTEIIIHTNKLTPNSMVYLTPNGSTQNQVVYIKSKSVSDVGTGRDLSLPADSYFTIALDNPLSSSVDINWWIIN